MLGGSGVYINYLVQVNPAVKKALYPEGSKADIEKHLSWFQGVLKTCGNRVNKMTIGAKVFGDKGPTPEELNAVSDEFFKRILKKFDQMLDSKKFVCGDALTVADLQYYCEMKNIITLLKKDVSDSEYPNTLAWMERVGAVPEVMTIDVNFKQMVQKYGI